MSYERIVTAFSRMYGHFAAVMDAEFNVLWASETVHPILGVDFPVGRNVLELLHPDDMGLALEAIPYHSENAETYSSYDATWMPEYSSLRFAKADGSWVRAEVTVFNMLDDPEVGALVGFGRRAQDRSDVPLAIDLVGSGAPLDEVLPVIARLIDRTFDGCRCQVLHWDGFEDVISIAPGGAALPDPPRDLIEAARRDRSNHQRVHLQTDPASTLAVIRSGFDAVWTLPIVAPGHEDSVVGCMVIWCEIPLELMMGPQQPLHQALRLASLAIVESQSRAALRWEASHDSLTGLANRAGFSASLGDTETDCALLFVDLDDFKPVNDRYGHEAGDNVLVEVARRVGHAVRDIDLVARLGGDEFAVLCPGIDLDGAVAIAHRIGGLVGRPISIGGQPVHVGASVGVAVAHNARERQSLIRRADAALYRAKGAGKRRVAIDGAEMSVAPVGERRSG